MAPLKPYQRPEVVRDFLVPKLQHELVLGCAHRNTIVRIDRMIRGAIRAWLRLPKDTSLGFLHAPVKSGGLGMPSLGTTLPLLQKKRFEKLLSSQTSTERTLVKLPSFQTTLRRVNLPCKVGKETVCSPQEGNEEWTRVLLTSADGRSLTTDDIDPASYHWIRKPHSVFPRLHLRGIQLRGGMLYTKARASRGRERSSEEVACRGGCQARETLNHILQSCEVTHNARCARHNRIVKLVKGLRRKVERTWIEPIITTLRSFIKPDILVETEHHITVLDVSVVANSRMKISQQLKVGKYGSQDNSEAIMTWINSEKPVKHQPVILSSRGLMYGLTGRGLRALGLTTRDLSDLCLLAVAGSLKCYDTYTR